MNITCTRTPRLIKQMAVIQLSGLYGLSSSQATLKMPSQGAAVKLFLITLTLSIPTRKQVQTYSVTAQRTS